MLLEQRSVVHRKDYERIQFRIILVFLIMRFSDDHGAVIVAREPSFVAQHLLRGKKELLWFSLISSSLLLSLSLLLGIPRPLTSSFA